MRIVTVAQYGGYGGWEIDKKKTAFKRHIKLVVSSIYIDRKRLGSADIDAGLFLVPTV